VFHETLERLQPQNENANYDGIVCALGGDFLSGPTPAIDDLQGQATLAENVFSLVNELVSGLTQLACMFAEVIVPCVAGTSGLTVPAGHTQAGTKVSGTMDYVLYCLLQRQMENVRNIRFVISETPELTFSTYQHRYTMASQAYLKASGRFAPQMDKLSSQSRKATRSQSQPVEYLLVSDGDEYRVVDNIVVNGSLRGPATASSATLAATASTQALWVGHPVHGVYLHQALKGDAAVIDEVEFPPISYSVAATRKATQAAFH
jgi:ABC-type Co2+ transport system permease subunit